MYLPPPPTNIYFRRQLQNQEFQFQSKLEFCAKQNRYKLDSLKKVSTNQQSSVYENKVCVGQHTCGSGNFFPPILGTSLMIWMYAVVLASDNCLPCQQNKTNGTAFLCSLFLSAMTLMISTTFQHKCSQNCFQGKRNEQMFPCPKWAVWKRDNSPNKQPLEMTFC